MYTNSDTTDKDMTEEISFGNWLRQRRRILDLTQQDFADLLGCARITLTRIEADTLKPSKQLASIILEKVGISVEEQDAWIRFARGQTSLPFDGRSLSLPKRKTNLPAALTSFIGREKEMVQVVKLLQKHRLVTLTGSGGVGKTRLALKTGEQLLDRYRDGVWLIELAPVFDRQIVARVIALAMGLRDEPQRPIMDMLCDYLREKELLLILDNCEHLLDSCAQLVNQLLKNCPSLKILVTSREAFGVLGEAAYRVPSLRLPELRQLLDKIRNYESIRLFEERAQLAETNFSLTLENVSSIAQICNRLGGIPLAIELAAARVSMFTTGQIAARLQDSLSILTMGNRAALPRHQTLYKAIEWSYDLLTPSEQSLFRRLSIFVNGWTLEAAESICSDTGTKPEDIANLLSQLINKSLANVEELQDKPRYRMLETIRKYANDKLVELGEGDTLSDTHLDYFLNLVEQAAPYLIRKEQLEWLSLLDFHYDNLRLALGWSLTKETPEFSLRLCAALGRFWTVRGYWVEGLQWLNSALAKPEQGPNEVEIIARVRALYYDAEIADQVDDIHRLQRSAELSFALAQKMPMTRDLAIARLYYGKYVDRKGEYANGQTLIEQSLDEFQELEDVYWQAQAYDELCLIHVHMGSADYFEKVIQNVEVARRTEERVTIAKALSEHYYQLYARGRIEEAKEIAIEVQDLRTKIGTDEGSTSLLLAEIAWLEGDYTLARSLFNATQDRLGEKGEKNIRSAIIASLGLLSMEEKKLDEAQKYVEQALAIAVEIGNQMFMSYRLAELGNISYLQNNIEKCRQNFQQSFSIAKNLTDPQKTSSLRSFLNVLYKREPKTVVIILGSIANFRKVSGVLGTPLHKRSFDLVEAYTRDTLGDATFESTFAKGQKLSLDDALNLALQSVELIIRLAGYV